MSDNNFSGNITDTTKSNKAFGRFLQIVSIIIVIYGILQLIVAPFSDVTILEGIKTVFVGGILFGVGKAIAWIHS